MKLFAYFVDSYSCFMMSVICAANAAARTSKDVSKIFMLSVRAILPVKENTKMTAADFEIDILRSRHISTQVVMKGSHFFPSAVPVPRSQGIMSRKYFSTLIQKFDAKVSSKPHNDAMVVDDFSEEEPASVNEKFSKQKISYGELNRAVDAFANGMSELGVGKGDVVLSIWTSTESLEYTYVQLGCAKAGVTLAVMDYNTGPSKICSALKSTKAKVIILPKRLGYSIGSISPSLKSLQWGMPLNSKDFPSLKILIQDTDETIEKGIYRLRDVLLYRSASGANSLKANDVALVDLKDGSNSSSFSNGDLLKKGFPFPTRLKEILA